MPSWYEEAALIFVEIARQDKALYREILKAIKRIQRNPSIGKLVLPDYRVYSDLEGHFRITYNHNPKLKEPVLIIKLVLLK